MTLEHTKHPYINIWWLMIVVTLYAVFGDSTYYKFTSVLVGYKLGCFIIDLIEYLSEDRSLNKYKKKEIK